MILAVPLVISQTGNNTKSKKYRERKIISGVLTQRERYTILRLKNLELCTMIDLSLTNCVKVATPDAKESMLDDSIYITNSGKTNRK